MPAWFHRPEHPTCRALRRRPEDSCEQARLPGDEGGAGASAGAEAGAAACCSVMSNFANCLVVFSWFLLSYLLCREVCR